MFKTTKRIIGWCSEYKARLYLGFVCAFFATWFGAAPTMVAAFTLGKAIDSARTGTVFDRDVFCVCRSSGSAPFPVFLLAGKIAGKYRL